MYLHTYCIRVGLPCLVFKSLALLLLGCDSTNQAQPYLEAGNQALTKHDWPLAIEQFDEAIQVSPGLIEAYTGRGSAHEKAGNLVQAAADYEQIVTLDPGKHEIHERLIGLYLELGDARKAGERLESLKGKISQVEQLTFQGQIELQQGDLAGALQSFEQAISIDRKMAIALYYHGIAKLRNGKTAEAEESFSAAIDAKPQFAAAYWQRSRIRRGLGQQEAADRDEQLAAEFDPSLGFANSSIGKNVLESLQTGTETLQPFRETTP